MPPETVIAVLSSHRHPRLRYVLKELRTQLGFRFQLMTELTKWQEVTAHAKVTLLPYAGPELAVQWPAHSFLSGSHPTSSDLQVNRGDNDLPLFFSVPQIQGLSHDYLAMIFFSLSRYEEYGDFTADQHHRFPASESHAARNGYLHLPVVNLWAKKLGDSLRNRFTNLPAKKSSAIEFIPTYDIDLLWAWKYRGLRGIGAGLQDALQGHFLRAWQRFVSPKQRDPYQTLDFLEGLHQTYAVASPIYFWLLADSTDRHDPNPYPIPSEQQEWMLRLAAKHVVGIHPGYPSSDQPALFPIETKRLADITGRAVRHSRQHFLRFRMPETFRQLRLAGITHDYSMGYADAIGWRAGTNFAFSWYDLEREETTNLMIHPFAAMDVTLKNYLHLAPLAAKQSVLQLAADLEPFGGPFMILWHNTSFAEIYGWAGWQEMYVQLVSELGDS
ncbi:polysaccharide deacetylase family protein [Neolewinella persica]|uniref:polysaccharide deacetylase family protein n=1 Tax=Neolewinella persica TaxID=70998 RepID=UPI0003694B37|nr:polysaccharide deacetylase family protein [Neolewinella persica]